MKALTLNLMKMDSSRIYFSIERDASQLLLRRKVFVGVLVGVVCREVVPPIRTPAEGTVSEHRHEFSGKTSKETHSLPYESKLQKIMMTMGSDAEASNETLLMTHCKFPCSCEAAKAWMASG